MGLWDQKFQNVGDTFNKRGFLPAAGAFVSNMGRNLASAMVGPEEMRKRREDESNAYTIENYKKRKKQQDYEDIDNFDENNPGGSGGDVDMDALMSQTNPAQPANPYQNVLDQPYTGVAQGAFPAGQGQPGSVAPPGQPAPAQGLDPSGYPLANADPMNKGPLFPNSGGDFGTPQTQPQPQVMAGRPPIQNPQKPGNVTGNPAAQPPIGGQSPVDGADTPWLSGLQNPGASPAGGGFSDDDVLAASKPMPGAQPERDGQGSSAIGWETPEAAAAWKPPAYTPGSRGNQGPNNGDPNRRLFASNMQQGVGRPGNQRPYASGPSIADRQGRQQAGLKRRQQQFQQFRT